MYQTHETVVWSRRHARWLQSVAKQLASSAEVSVTSTKYATIEKRLCRAFKISVAELRSRRNAGGVSFARHAVAYWACRRSMMSTPDIGIKLGRDHSTVIRYRNDYPAKRLAMGRHLRVLPGGRKESA